jgi:hypothetical protein
MAKCECDKRIQEGMKEAHGLDGHIIDYEILSGKSFSTFRYKTVNSKGKESKKDTFILHKYCPFCGQKYEQIGGGE